MNKLCLAIALMLAVPVMARPTYSTVPAVYRPVQLNPQPLPPGSTVELNPQPLPPRVTPGGPVDSRLTPGSTVELNPQPLPPRWQSSRINPGGPAELNPQPLPPRTFTAPSH